MRFRTTGCILLLLFAAWFCRAEEFGEISVETVPLMLQEGGKFQYFVREFRLENRGAEPAEIWMRLRANSQSVESCSAERSVLLPPGAVRNVKLFWPRNDQSYFARYFYDVALDLVINGRAVRHSIQVSGSSTVYSRISLASESLPFDQYRQFLKDNYSSRVEVSSVPVAQWGRNARDYAGIHSVWISSEDRLPPEVETALRRWMFGGGALVVCVPPDAAWPEGKEPENGVMETRHGWGKRILCRPIPPGGLKKLKTSDSGDDMKASGGADLFGGNPPGSEDTPKYEITPGLIRLEILCSGDTESGMNLASEFMDVLALEIPTIPLHWLFFVMLLFVILIGPVNYFVLKKFHREMLLLATTPAISLLFCLLVIGFITVSEGWYSRAKAYGITLLDQENRLAATRVMLGIYAPVPPGGGFVFPVDEKLNFYGAGEIDLSLNEGQHFRSGLLQPRIPLFAAIECVTPQREQLRIVREKGGISVVNGLGVKLTGLGVVDDEGRLFVTDDPVDPGARVQLKPTSFRTGRSEMNWEELLKQFGRSDAPEKNFIRENIKNFAGGFYVALAEEPLFYTPGFEPDQFEANHLVFGRYSFSGEE